MKILEERIGEFEQYARIGKTNAEYIHELFSVELHPKMNASGYLNGPAMGLLILFENRFSLHALPIRASADLPAGRQVVRPLPIEGVPTPCNPVCCHARNRDLHPTWA